MSGSLDGDALIRISLELSGMLRSRLSTDRYLHTLRVARTASLLAVPTGVDRNRAWLAGLAHDWAREWSPRESLHFLEHHGQEVSSEERHRPVLVHGRIAALLLRQDFGFDDPEIAEAVSHHTLGRAGMGNLARLVFVADYLEPGRKFSTPEFRHLVRRACMPCMVRLVIEHNAKRHGDLHWMTKELYDEAGGGCATGICREWRWYGHE